jgi:hypothetical protein
LIPVAINITSPANLLVKDMTSGIFSYEFFKNLKAFSEARVIGTGEENIFNLNYESLEPYQGQFEDRAILQNIPGLATKRDYANGGNSANILTMSSRNDDGVRCMVKMGPVDLGEDAGRVAIMSKERLVQHFAEQCALEFKAYLQQFLFGSASAAIQGMTGAAHTYNDWVATGKAATNYLTTSALGACRQALLDRAGKYIGQGKGLWVFPSQCEYDLASSQVVGNIYEIVRDVVTSGAPMTYGAPFFTLDDLTTQSGTSPATKNVVLGLGEGLANIKIKEPQFYIEDQRLEYETVVNFLRADCEFSIQLVGFAYNKTAGGANPDLATIATGSNWTPNYIDHREVHGVVGLFNSSLN